MPRVSIILPVYNERNFISDAIKSVLSQTFEDWELIVMDDASTDNSVEIIRSFMARDRRIILHQAKTNLGLVANLNRAIAMAQGEFLARIDGDDEWGSPNKLSDQINFFKTNPEAVLVGTNALLINLQGKKIGTLKHPSTHKQIINRLGTSNCFIHTSVLMKKDAVLAVGGYKSEALYAEDYDLWLRLGLVGKLANLEGFYVNYRHNPSGISQTHSLAQMRAMIKILWLNRGKYPHFYTGMFKWFIQFCILVIFRRKGYDWLKAKFSLIYGSE